MTRWKRGVALLLVAAMTCSVAGCGSKKEETTTATTEVTEEGKLTDTGILGLTAAQEYFRQFDALALEDIVWD